MQVLADVCTGIPIDAAQVRQQDQLTEQLQRALDSRVPIEQAKGIVADARQQSVDRALDRIRQHAGDRNRHPASSGPGHHATRPARRNRTQRPRRPRNSTMT